ncbi:MAG: hypothetical protein ACR2MB_16855 [Acidimicrobiales bacterium]
MTDWSELYDMAPYGDAYYDAGNDDLHLADREFVREPFATAWRARNRLIHGAVLVQMVKFFERDVDSTYAVTGKLVDGLYKSIADAWRTRGADALNRDEAHGYLDDAMYELDAEDVADLAGIFGCDRVEYLTTIFSSNADALDACKKALRPRVERMLRKLDHASRSAPAGRKRAGAGPR